MTRHDYFRSVAPRHAADGMNDTCVTHQPKELKTGATCCMPSNLLIQQGKKNNSLPPPLTAFLSLTKNKSGHLSQQVESNHWEPVAIVVKTKEERWGSQPPVTWVCPGPVHAFATQIRRPLQTTQREAGKRTRRCSGSRTIEERAQGPSIVIPLIHHFSPELLKRKGASCVRERWAIMSAALDSFSFLSRELDGRGYTPSGIHLSIVKHNLWRHHKSNC